MLLFGMSRTTASHACGRAFASTFRGPKPGVSANLAATPQPECIGKQARVCFDRWNASLATRDPKKVVANYAQKSVLLPTMSNEPRPTSVDKLDYFSTFLQSGPQATIDKSWTYSYGKTIFHSGIYTFRFAENSNTVTGKFSFTYNWVGNRWLITSHHSSLLAPSDPPAQP